jgi:hypothetical protein
VATIRVGEKLMQRYGPKRPMLWGTAITAVGILLTSLTFLLIGQYTVVAFIGFTLYGIGLGFYATPSTDAAMSSEPNDKAGEAAGLYKMASSLGSAFGVAISAAIYTAAAHIPAHLVPHIFLRPPEQYRPALRRRARPALQRLHVRRRPDLDHRGGPGHPARRRALRSSAGARVAQLRKLNAGHDEQRPADRAVDEESPARAASIGLVIS